MVVRKRVSNKRRKRSTAHKGRVICCGFLVPLPVCITAAQLVVKEVLLEFSGAGTCGSVDGIYTYCGQHQTGTYCFFVWEGPSSPYFVSMRFDVATGFVDMAMSNGGSCATLGGGNTGPGGLFQPGSGGVNPSVADFLCNEVPLNGVCGGGENVKITVYDP